MTLREEIAADSIHRSTGCSVCAWLALQPADDDWPDIMADRALTHAAIYRAMKRRGYQLGSSKPIESHRNDGHAARGD